MTIRIPRAEVAALTAHHTYPWRPEQDVTPAQVRGDARNRRYLADQHDSEDEQRQLHAEADELDGLAGRYERGAA